MLDAYIPVGASAHEINRLAAWVREHVAKANSGEFDIIKFIEIDLLNLYPAFYVIIEDDENMQLDRAYFDTQTFSLVISESIYTGASNGCKFSSEIILHEVGHAILHVNFGKGKLNNSKSPYIKENSFMKKYNSAEWQADNFAISFLYPYDMVSKFANSLEIAKAFNITERQASRVFEHYKKLRFREIDRNIKKEASLIKRVSSIYSTSKYKKYRSDQNGQLAFI